MLHINRENLKASHQLLWFIIDMVMLALLFLNLALIIWDSIYNVTAVQQGLASHLPWLHQAYEPIHEQFFFYDLGFVAIFLTEFIVRWGYAIHQDIYDRWYFYPFIHWYDLLGCIPVGSFRFLRILRVVSIVYRLHQYRIIDVTNTRLYRFLNFYYDAFMEELSDRIVVKVLSGFQDEVRRGSPLFDHIRRDILFPRRDMLAEWLSRRVADAAQEGYLPNRGALRHYLEQQVNQALKQNVELSRLKYLPVVGPTIQGTLEDAVGDIVATVIHQILEDLASPDNHGFVSDLVVALLPEPDDASQRDDALIDLVVDIIEAVKGQVAVKHWRARLP